MNKNKVFLGVTYISNGIVWFLRYPLHKVSDFNSLEINDTRRQRRQKLMEFLNLQRGKKVLLNNTYSKTISLTCNLYVLL